MSKLTFAFCLLVFFAKLGLLQGCAKLNEKCNPFTSIGNNEYLCCEGTLCVYPEGKCEVVDLPQKPEQNENWKVYEYSF
nr:venom peptide [Acharia stimulea]